MSETAPREESATEGAPFAPRVEQPLAPRVDQPLAFREDLPVPEPWSRTLWEVAKPLPLSFGLMYGLQHLFMPGGVLEPSWFLWMGGFLSAQGVLQRRKGLYHPQSMIVFGGVMLAASAFVVLGGLVSGEGDGLAMGAVFVTISAVILLTGFRARILERERVARLEEDAVNPASVAGAIPVATLRERVQRFRERTARLNKRVLAGFASVVATTFGSLTLSTKYNWPEIADLGTFLFFWAGVGGMLWYTSRVTREAALESQLECPACKRPLVGTLGSHRLMSQLEDLGRCPQCAARITVEVL